MGPIVADPKALPRSAEIAVLEGEIVIGDARIRYERLDINVNANITHTADITPEAAEAMKQAAHAQYAVPAQEETKRAIEETKRVRFVTGCVVLAAFIIAFRPETGWPLAVLVGVFGSGTVAIPKVIDKLKAPSNQA